jgi:hypothetical protein
VRADGGRGEERGQGDPSAAHRQSLAQFVVFSGPSQRPSPQHIAVCPGAQFITPPGIIIIPVPPPMVYP